MEYLAIPPALEVYFYALLFIFALVFFIGLAGKLSILARAGGEGPGVSGVLILSVASFFSADCLVARRVFPRSRVRGLMLVAIMWGFVVSLATLVVSWVANLLGLGPPYPLVSIAGELAGAVLLLALLYGLIRKLYVDRKGEVWTVPEDYTFLVLFFILVLSGFLVEGARISLGGGDSYSPVGGGSGIATGELPVPSPPPFAALLPHFSLPALLQEHAHGGGPDYHQAGQGEGGEILLKLHSHGLWHSRSQLYLYGPYQRRGDTAAGVESGPSGSPVNPALAHGLEGLGPFHSLNEGGEFLYLMAPGIHTYFQFPGTFLLHLYSGLLPAGAGFYFCPGHSPHSTKRAREEKLLEDFQMWLPMVGFCLMKEGSHGQV